MIIKFVSCVINLRYKIVLSILTMNKVNGKKNYTCLYTLVKIKCVLCSGTRLIVITIYQYIPLTTKRMLILFFAKSVNELS